MICLATLDAALGQKNGEAIGQGNAQDRESEGVGVEEGVGVGPRGRFKKLRLSNSQMDAYLTGRKYPRIKNLMPGFEIVAFSREVGQRVVVFTIRSEAFPLVEAGESIPELEQELDYTDR
ncbi:MAG: hypothetical protein ACJ8FY_10505 [Gemmataceae bacterium]